MFDQKLSVYKVYDVRLVSNFHGFFINNSMDKVKNCAVLLSTDIMKAFWFP